MAKNTRSNVYEGGLLVDPTAGAGVPATVGAILPRVNTTELWQKFAAGDTQWQLLTISGAVFPPTRVALVDPARGNDGTGVYGGIPFATIAGALASAPALSPTELNPLLIIVAPGAYAAPLTLVSNVHISTLSGTQNNVIVSGAITWLAGAGPNAPQVNDQEDVWLHGLRLVNTTTLDTTAKLAQTGEFYAHNCEFNGGITSTLRSPGDVTDLLTLRDCLVPGPYDASGGAHFSADCEFGDDITGTNSAEMVWESPLIDGIITLGTSSSIVAISGRSSNNILVGAASNFAAIGGQYNGNLSTTAAGAGLQVLGGQTTGSIVAIAGSVIDLRNTIYAAGSLGGAGAINRSLIRLTPAPSAIGANVVAITPPLPDATYVVTFTALDPSIPAFPPIVSAMAAGSFTYLDTTANQEYLVSITKEQ